MQEQNHFTVTVEGHDYQINNLEEGSQRLHFIEKKQVGDKLVTVSDGVGTEAVIAVLVNRLQELNTRLEDSNTEKAIEYLRGAYACLVKRTEERKAAGVEGTHEPIPSTTEEVKDTLNAPVEDNFPSQADENVILGIDPALEGAETTVHLTFAEYEMLDNVTLNDSETGEKTYLKGDRLSMAEQIGDKLVEDGLAKKLSDEFQAAPQEESAENQG